MIGSPQHVPVPVHRVRFCIMSVFETVTSRVLVATHPFCTTTTTVVIGDAADCLIVDPAVTVEEVDGMAAELSRLGLAIAAGFSTHPHWDHLLWRVALGAAPRYATAAAANVARSRVEHNVTHSAGPAPGYDQAVFTRVTALAPGADVLPWTGRRVEVIEHRAHAQGHAALYLPDERVLIAGDMLSDIEIPLPDHDAADPLADYVAALDMFAALDVDVLIPGHGTVGDTAEFRRRLNLDRRYLDAVTAGTEVADPRFGDAAEWLHREHATTMAHALDKHGPATTQ